MLTRLIRDKACLRICAPTHLVGPIQQLLTYRKKIFLATYAERQAHAGRNVIYEEVACTQPVVTDGETHLLCAIGFLPRIKVYLSGLGCKFVVEDVAPWPQASTFEPGWDVVDRISLRPGQRETLEKIVRLMSGLGRGQVIWPTGAGKSFLISVICLLFRNARIIVTTKFLDPLKDLHRNIQSVIPTAGIWGGSSHRKGERVSCVSMGTLHHALRDPPDLLIVDEVHEVATSKQMEVLAAFKDARILGLSANHYDRTDGADFELEGLCGPLISQMTYQQAESLGMISPIHVKFLDVDLSLDPCGLRQGALKKQAGLWTNQARNAIFAEELRKYPDDQCLAAVDTVEHAIYLKQLLPEYELVYASIDPEDVVYYQKLGLLPANFTPLSPAGREQLKRDFESGKLRKAIATTVWKRGVNFKQLAVLALLSGSADDISATQIPGRLSRLHSGKSYGLLLDAWDRFNKGFESASRSRMRLYRHLGWTVDLARKAEVVHGGAGGGG